MKVGIAKLVEIKSIHIIFYLALTIISTHCLSQTNTQSDKHIPVLDKSKSYRSKEFEFQAQYKYVLLETSREVLLGENCKLKYASDNRLLFADEYGGDVFIFDINGKIYSKFNQKGGLGYTSITSIIYDETKNELFILDRIRKKIYVFSEKGALLRSFKTPEETFIAEIYNFNDSTLLAFDENLIGTDKPTKPYFFISRNSGNIIGYVNITVEKVNATQFMESISKNESLSYSFIYTGIPDNCKFGNDFILSNKSMDTVYVLRADKSLEPLFTQIPSVHSEHTTAASVGMFTDKYLQICVADYDISAATKTMKSGKTWNPPFKLYILDRETREFYRDSEKGKYTVHKTDTPLNHAYSVMPAIILKEKNKLGRLKGELKTIASKITINDNPVVEIIQWQ
ncbi:6-bladed beta-propeller [uncultured Draconibacterium sp.]|uniref:6-bladed beta-propeller n=1 Tax=uncultured Draconibacterium sp. TaxID=1573823 RepID=UPI002AA93A0F|nr:6-bladed beta-propeller [uncultured Draconibacterium sp.]